MIPQQKSSHKVSNPMSPISSSPKAGVPMKDARSQLAWQWVEKVGGSDVFLPRRGDATTTRPESFTLTKSLLIEHPKVLASQNPCPLSTWKFYPHKIPAHWAPESHEEHGHASKKGACSWGGTMFKRDSDEGGISTCLVCTWGGTRACFWALAIGRVRCWWPSVLQECKQGKSSQT